MKKTILRKYAKLLVRSGVNIQKGQALIVRAENEIYPFVEILVEEAYRAGASDVRVDWRNQTLTKLAYRHCSLRTLADVPTWLEERMKEQVEKLPALISLVSDDPNGMRGMNMKKLMKVQQKRYQVFKPYYDQLDNRYQWLVAAVPGKAWAKAVFPELRPAAAVEKLWACILEACMVTEDNDPIAAWEEKDRQMEAKCAMLNRYRFDTLEYKNSLGTDFRCALMPQSLWCGGGDKTLSGIYFNANMPTEEVFTTPWKGKCDGKLVASMPLSYQGTLIKDFWIRYEDGKAVEWDAGSGKEVLDSIMRLDEGALMLGELALVPVDSPISNQHMLYYETLFDENASCHVAIGEGYTACVEGFADMTLEQLHELGVNESQEHVDFMIGTPDLTVIGWKDGKPTTIFENGNWAL